MSRIGSTVLRLVAPLVLVGVFIASAPLIHHSVATVSAISYTPVRPSQFSLVPSSNRSASALGQDYRQGTQQAIAYSYRNHPTTTTSTTVPSNGINYHGGPVITAPTKVYEIWYGNWTTSSTPARQQLIDTFLRGFGGTPWFNTNTTYYNGSGVRVQNALSVGGSYSVPGAYSTALSDSGVAALVTSAISSGSLPSDPNGIYLVFTSRDVNETSGFLTKYCGWHTATTYNSTAIKYGFVGDPSANLAACSAQSVSPNGDVAGDAMVSVVAHEISEAVSDPQLNAWWNSYNGEENGDLCAWKFGTFSRLPNGAAYNVTWTYNNTAYNYLIQQLWANASGGYCTLKY